MVKTLRVILWDQLNKSTSSLDGLDKQKDVILLFETREAATFVKHHKKKLVLLFSAMRHFAQELKDEGYEVDYVSLKDPQNTQVLMTEINRAAQKHRPDKIVVTEPSDYTPLEKLKEYKKGSSIPFEILENKHFLCSKKDFRAWAKTRKNLRMEFFYREMRKKYSILMEKGKPLGGKWNFDKENRAPPKEGLKPPTSFMIEPDNITQEVIEIVQEDFSNHFGDVSPFHFAVTREDALTSLHRFIKERLPLFGTFQDAMIEGEPWMFHSHLSFYLNCGLLEPLECIRAAELAYHSRGAPLNAVEGFIRQILGWREYVRGIYWLKMPEYKSLNHLSANRHLPSFFWDGKTELNCLRQCILETKKNAYAHHIQRLMVLGNFCLLTGIHPEEVNEWYLIVYADAFEWVEMPNVTGMILYADEGLLGSKPYAASGSYIKKMSNYCENCKYSVDLKEGEKACPFNYLYWNFLKENKKLLEHNPRMRMIYNVLSKMSDVKVDRIKSDSKRFLDSL